jgi:hypothetical protein
MDSFVRRGFVSMEVTRLASEDVIFLLVGSGYLRFTPAHIGVGDISVDVRRLVQHFGLGLNVFMWKQTACARLRDR